MQCNADDTQIYLRNQNMQSYKYTQSNQAEEHSRKQTIYPQGVSLNCVFLSSQGCFGLSFPRLLALCMYCRVAVQSIIFNLHVKTIRSTSVIQRLPVIPLTSSFAQSVERDAKENRAQKKKLPSEILAPFTATAFDRLREGGTSRSLSN